MKNRGKILIALFSALVLLTAVTLTGCFGDEEGEKRKRPAWTKTMMECSMSGRFLCRLLFSHSTCRISD